LYCYNVSLDLKPDTYGKEIEKRAFSGGYGRERFPQSHEGTNETGITAFGQATHGFLAEDLFRAKHMSLPFHSVHIAHLVSSKHGASREHTSCKNSKHIVARASSATMVVGSFSAVANMETQP
jgi:hypothetical protein